MIHQHENNQDTEQHLHENADKLEADGIFLWKQMQRGEVMTRQSVLKKYDIDGRRLGELCEAGKCQKRWALKPNGKRSHVEYFVNIPKPPTKKEIMSKWNELAQAQLFIHQ